MNRPTRTLLHLGYWIFYCLVVSVLYVLTSDDVESAFADRDDGLFILACALLTGLVSIQAIAPALKKRSGFDERKRIFQFPKTGPYL